MKEYKAFVCFDPETKLFVGIIPSVQGVYTTGEALVELNSNLEEVLSLWLEEAEKIREFSIILD